MIQGRERLGLALEARESVGILGEAVRKNLDRDLASERRVCVRADCSAK